jgi:hypothetical protein
MHQRTERGFASVAQLLSFFAVGSAAIMPPLAYVSATTVTSFRAPETLPQRGAASILAGNSLAENVMPFETPLSRDYATDAACSSRDEVTFQIGSDVVEHTRQSASIKSRLSCTGGGIAR